jgi:cell division protein FtsB
VSGPSDRAAARRQARRTPSSATKTTQPSLRRRTATTRTATTRTVSAAARGRVGAAASAVRDRPSLTGRAVVLALVLGLLAVSLAVPVREVFRQRADINALRAGNASARDRVAALTVRQQQLSDPAYVTSLVRERLHYVLPGEVGYVVLDPAEAPAPSAAKAAAALTPWWSTLWSSVQTADQAARPPADAPIPVRSNAPR